VTDAAAEQFEHEGIAAGQIRFLRYGNLRYENQEHGVEVLLPDGRIDDDAVAQVAERFHETYEREYTYRLDAPVEFVGAHVVAFAEVGKLAPMPLAPTGRSLSDASKGRRTVDFATDGIHESEVYDGERLEPGHAFMGPAIVETRGTTIVVHPGNEATVDDYGNIIIALGGDGL
jgi:N-methylhydantoinase A